MNRTLLWLAAFVAFASHAVAGVFDVAGKPAESISAYLPGHEPVGEPSSNTPWDIWLQHPLASSELTKLRSTASSNKRVAIPESAEVVYVLVCERDTATTVIELLRDDAGRFFARIRESDASEQNKDQPKGGSKSDEEKIFELNRDKAAALTYSWPKCRAAISKPGSTPPQSDAKTINLDLLKAGWFTVDQNNIENRFVHGKDTKNSGAVRVLKDARGVVRIPKNYNPSMASGLVVFIHAMPDAIIPQAVAAICDELGFLCVAAADVGNETPIADRLQRTLDAVTTVQEQYLIDQSRVYATGISGGGKLSVHAWLGYSEVFRGAVPCVGMSAYENLKRADGKYYRGDFPKPNASKIASLKDHRVAAVTGDRDFNYEHIKLSVKLYQRDKFDIKLFDVPGMEHTFAPEGTFSDALRWVDEPWRDARAKAITKTVELTKQFGQKKDTISEQDRQTALRAAPFTPEGWAALDALGVQPKK